MHRQLLPIKLSTDTANASANMFSFGLTLDSWHGQQICIWWRACMRCNLNKCWIMRNSHERDALRERMNEPVFINQYENANCRTEMHRTQRAGHTIGNYLFFIPRHVNLERLTVTNGNIAPKNLGLTKQFRILWITAKGYLMLDVGNCSSNGLSQRAC